MSRSIRLGLECNPCGVDELRAVVAAAGSYTEHTAPTWRPAVYACGAVLMVVALMIAAGTVWACRKGAGSTPPTGALTDAAAAKAEEGPKRLRVPALIVQPDSTMVVGFLSPRAAAAAEAALGSSTMAGAWGLTHK